MPAGHLQPQMSIGLRTFRKLTAPLISPSQTPFVCFRCASNSSSTRWQTRQSRDTYSKKRKLDNLMSRAAYKLISIHENYKIFKKGQTVVDLGFAPGSWSQVAISSTFPGGRIVGVDIIPALPPKGASTFQGNFTNPNLQASLRKFLSDPDRGRPRQARVADDSDEVEGYIDWERRESHQAEVEDEEGSSEKSEKSVHVVLSDMSEPWPKIDGYYKQSLINPYYRLMNTSGIGFQDHVRSIDLCNSALLFCMDVLKPGGTFVCKFYQGGEDKELEKRLQKVFKKVFREKPESSRKESKEMYFVALDLRPGVTRADVEPPN